VYEERPEYKEWDDNLIDDKPYVSTLDRILAKVSDFIDPRSKIEEYDINLENPWDDININLLINGKDKETASKEHKLRKKELDNEENLIIYSDGSLI